VLSLAHRHTDIHREQTYAYTKTSTPDKWRMRISPDAFFRHLFFAIIIFPEAVAPF